jgi:hypothetical protein
MNPDQRDSLIRSILKIAGTAALAHGLAATSTWINSEDAAGLIILLVGLWQSHIFHGAAAAPAPRGDDFQTRRDLIPAPIALAPAAGVTLAGAAGPVALPDLPKIL